MFYVRQLGGEQLCGSRILAEFRGGQEVEESRGGENSFWQEKWSRMPNAQEAPVLPVEGGGEKERKKKAADQGPASAITLP